MKTISTRPACTKYIEIRSNTIRVVLNPIHVKLSYHLTNFRNFAITAYVNSLALNLNNEVMRNSPIFQEFIDVISFQYWEFSSNLTQHSSKCLLLEWCIKYLLAMTRVIEVVVSLEAIIYRQKLKTAAKLPTDV